MTNSRIASAFLAPALAAILAIACSSSDNNGGNGASVGGGNGGASSGPSPVTNTAACNDALGKAKKCATSTPTAEQEKQFRDVCNAAKSSCAQCVIDADTDCPAVAACLTSADCAPAGDGGTGGTSSGKGGSSSGKGGSSSGKGGTGGTQSTDPETCISDCTDANAEGSDFFNQAFIAECACKAGATCASACTEGCAGGEPSAACNDCLNDITNSDKCVSAANSACAGDESCSALIECAQGCSGGSGGSGGGSGQACVDQCGADNQAGVPKFNEEAPGVKACLCDGNACKDKCADSPICTEPNGNQGTQECIDCQFECFPKCEADPDCKKLLDCVKGCN